MIVIRNVVLEITNNDVCKMYSVNSVPSSNERAAQLSNDSNNNENNNRPIYKAKYHKIIARVNRIY